MSFKIIAFIVFLILSIVIWLSPFEINDDFYVIILGFLTVFSIFVSYKLWQMIQTKSFKYEFKGFSSYLSFIAILWFFSMISYILIAYPIPYLLHVFSNSSFKENAVIINKYSTQSLNCPYRIESKNEYRTMNDCVYDQVIYNRIKKGDNVIYIGKQSLFGYELDSVKY
ncbi:MAG: hypothetical protein A3D90_09045 [Sulfuricurvum sp. RIFCSPHIGHO2_02_FULL_43_9]|nr:MAG: hypothetical protein A3D90_09045 [Sulfuricurvum sp. RIFCSPHIGHO2_02_FULL_43_9]